MTIASIHILEALAVLLVCFKLLKIRSLYLNSRPSALRQSPQAKMPQTRKTSSIPKQHNPAKKHALDKEANSNLFLTPLPEPEVLFSNDHEELVLSEVPQVTENENKSILNSYIDDFFCETPQDSFFESEIKTHHFNKPESKASNEDEFITVQEENAELVRAINSLKREIGIPARG